jgi:hypothetical protein
VKKLPVITIWAVAFAFVEAAVVEYLRALYYPADKGGFVFPLMTAAKMQALGLEDWHRLFIELGRELSTLIMLGGVGIMASRNRREAWAYFMIAFGIWDIFYYLWLKLFLNWPAHLTTWDLLFLIPVPWVSPVWAPVVVSLTMIAVGLVVLWYEGRDCPLRPSWTEWALITVGGMTVIVSCCWDYRNTMEGGMPAAFLWPLFLAGLTVGLATFLTVWRRGHNEYNAVKRTRS